MENKDIVISGTGSTIKKKVIDESLLDYKCHGEKCTLTNEWLNKPLSLHLEHNDGDHRNNKLSNLEFLCPNCHSQTETYCGNKNKEHGHFSQKNKKVSDKDLVASIRRSSSVAEALDSVGMSGANNYKRVYRLMSRYGIPIDMKPPYTKVKACENCKRYFHPKRKTRKFCCVPCRHEHDAKQRKKPKPTEEQILADLEKYKYYTVVGRIYGVTDNGIRKWLKGYEEARKNNSCQC